MTVKVLLVCCFSRKTITTHKLLFFTQWLCKNCVGLIGETVYNDRFVFPQRCDGYDKPFLSKNRFLSNLILWRFHRSTFRNCMSNSGELISVETRSMIVLPQTVHSITQPTNPIHNITLLHATSILNGF